jgi:hypothetical protein
MRPAMLLLCAAAAALLLIRALFGEVPEATAGAVWGPPVPPAAAPAPA